MFVELALALPLFMILILGTFSGGVAYNRKITLTSAARDAARYGTTHPVTTTTDAWLIDVAQAAVNNAQGELDAGTTGRDICVAYVPPNGTNARYLDWTTTNSGTAANGTCPGVTLSNSTTDTRAQVVVKRSAELQAMVFTMNLNLHSEAVGRIEQ